MATKAAVWVPPLLPRALRSHATLPRRGKRRAAQEEPVPEAPRPRKKAASTPPSFPVPEENLVLTLPEEIKHAVVAVLVEDSCPEDIASLSQTCRLFHSVATDECHWSKLYTSKFGSNPTANAAARLAGGFRKLYASKTQTEKIASPWKIPSCFEVSAMLEDISQPGAQSSPSVVFLVDGSGSVTEDDFACMTNFMRTAAQAINHKANVDAKMAVVQFSNEIKVELPLDRIGDEAFAEGVNAVARMNGGTNIASAIREANAMFTEDDAQDEGAKVVILLTDGRVDSSQAREAVEQSVRMTNQFPECRLFAFGVGRGVDNKELVRIIGRPGESKLSAEGRYLGLRTLEEPPW